MHLRMDRFKTLRWLMVLVAFIYFAERGMEKIIQPVHGLITQTFDDATKFVLVMSKENAKDREEAEAFQQSLDRRNRLSEKRFQWKRPAGRSLESRSDEFRVEKDKDGKVVGVYSAHPQPLVAGN